MYRSTATCTNAKNGTMERSGAVKGNEIDATAKMIKQGKEPMNMSAKGIAAKMEHMEHESIKCGRKQNMGPGRIGLPTSRLSGARSNQLSYGPKNLGYRPSNVRRSKRK